MDRVLVFAGGPLGWPCTSNEVDSDDIDVSSNMLLADTGDTQLPNQRFRKVVSVLWKSRCTTSTGRAAGESRAAYAVRVVVAVAVPGGCGTGKGSVHLAERTELVVVVVLPTSPASTATNCTFLVQVLLGTGAAAAAVAASADAAAAAAQRTVPSSFDEVQ